MWNLKKKKPQMNLFTKQIVTDVENKHGYQGEKEVRKE